MSLDNMVAITVSVIILFDILERYDCHSFEKSFLLGKNVLRAFTLQVHLR